MVDNVTLARPYAKALFDIALADDDFLSWANWLERLVDLLSQDDLILLVKTPKLSVLEKNDVLKTLLKTNTTKQLQFLELLCQNQRLDVAPRIFDIFQEMSNLHHNILQLTVKTAFELTVDQEDYISNVLSQKFMKQIDMTVIVDPQLIGGIVICIGDKIMDLSVRGSLKQLEIELRN